MNRITMFAAAFAALTALVNGAAAHAEQADNRRFAFPANPSQSMTTVAPNPSFSVLGAPVGIDAPVAPPYANSAYRNFGGQPATGFSTFSVGPGRID
ncbi:MAG TPA: hypothetical protein VJY39_21115 [Acidisphaera sp.]|nr:hypothetical protein [Acidisphaera sp.]